MSSYVGSVYLSVKQYFFKAKAFEVKYLDLITCPLKNTRIVDQHLYVTCGKSITQKFEIVLWIKIRIQIHINDIFVMLIVDCV